jgi:hypothetical protein
MGNFLAKLAGAREEILAQCPTERIKFQGLGSAILITSCIATVSMWFALASAMGINPMLAFPIAILWGLVILGIDRWLVTSIPPHGKRRVGIAMPRVVLAILLGTLISTPIVLRAFQSDINTQIALIHQQRASQFLAQQQNSKVNHQVAYWSGQVTSLDKVINSGGQAPLNPAADPDVQSLTTQRNYWTAQQQKDYRQWQCQLYGGPGCPAGNGPLAQASHQTYLAAGQQVRKIEGEITARENVLSATDKNSEHIRLQQAKSALPNAEQELNNATAQEDALRNSYENANLASNGLLIRLQALNELSSSDFTLNATRFLLFLFFLVIECLPVTVKLLQKPGVYEEILQATAERERLDAIRGIRGGFGPASTADAAGSASGVPTDGPDIRGPAGAPVGVDQRRAAAREVWQPRPPTPRWANTGASAPTMSMPGEPGSRSELDAALRGLRDTRRTPTAPDGPAGPGGPELNYDDDDL